MISDRLTWLFLITFMNFNAINGQETGLPDYVVSECYGDIFNFDCGAGNKIRINRDFFGYSGEQGCRYSRGDCIISNPKSNSLIHRYCTGHRVCTYYLVERRGCGGAYSNYQQVEYQCIPDTKITNICDTAKYETTSTYIASPNFPENYPPNVDCRCIVSTTDPDSKVRLEVVYLAVKYTWPCKDWLQIGRRRTCGTNVDLYQGRTIPISFRSDKGESHSGFWLHFQSSGKDSKILVRCGNATMTPAPPVTRKPPTTPTSQPNTTIETKGTKEREPTTLPPSTDADEDKLPIADDKASLTDENDNNIFTGEEQVIGKNSYDFSDSPYREETPNKPDKHGSNGENLRPTVPPNLPFANIERPDDIVTPFDSNILNEASDEDQRGPDKPKRNHHLDATEEGENRNENFVPITPSPSTETGFTDTPSFPFPSKNRKDDTDTTLDNDVDRDQDDNVGSVSLAETPLPEEYYPANDIMEEQITERTTTTTQPTPVSAIVTLLDNSDNKAEGNDTDETGSINNPSMDVMRPNEFEEEHDEDDKIISKPYPQHKIPDRGDTDSGDMNNSTTTVDIVTPTQFNDRTNIPHSDYKDEPDKPSGNHPVNPPFHTVNDVISYPYPVDQETSTHFSIDDYEDYEDGYRHAKKLNLTDNAKVAIDINNVSEESDTNNDAVTDPETGKDFHDMTKINSVHDEKNKVNSNGYPTDFNVPGVTGGNFTFNSTTSHNTTVITKATKEEDGGIITLGLIILCICIGVGILLVICVLLAIYCRRRRGTRNEETQTSGGNTKSKTIVVVGMDQDGDSGQGLLVIGNGHVHGVHHDKGHTHRKSIVSPLEHPGYPRPKRADKSMQIDFDSGSEYDDVMIYDRDYTLEDIDSEVSFMQSSPSPLNHKCVQVRTGRPYMTTVRPSGHGPHGRRNLSPGRHKKPMSPGRPPRPMSPSRHNVSQPLKRSYGVDDIAHQVNQKPLPPRRTATHSAEPVERNTSVGIDVNNITNDIHVEPTHGYNVQRRKHSMYRISDSEVDSDTDIERIKRESLASMSELAEMTMSPENTMDSRHLEFDSDSESSDWDQRSAISI